MTGTKVHQMDEIRESGRDAKIGEKVENETPYCGSSCVCVGVVLNEYSRRRWTVRAFDGNTYGAWGTGTLPREGCGDRHHAITDPDEMIMHE